MQIIIAGDGKVGYALAEQLSLEENDVTIIDSSAQALQRALEKLDVLCIQGSGASENILREAGVEHADLFIAVTSRDEMNMICCLRAHKMGAKRIVARIRNPEYATSEDFIRRDLGIDLTINPELFAASEISRLLRYSHAHSMETFAQNHLEMVEFIIQKDSPIGGQTLRALTPKIPARVLFCAVERDDEVTIPGGDFVLEEGDHVHIAGEPTQMHAFARYMGFVKKKVRSVMIVGGSRIAYYLSSQLLSLGMHVVIIENDRERCEELAGLLPEAVIVYGDGTDQDVLEQERIEEMDAFVALTNRDEENILCALQAKERGVGRCVAKITRLRFPRIADDLSLVSPKDLTANRIVRYVRALNNSEGSFVEKLYRIVGGQAEVMEFTAQNSARLLGVPLKSMQLKKGVLIAAIVHRGHITIPFGEDVIREGDTVIIVTKGRVLTDLNDILS
jgi:trk system potassium uptake protein TrkA